jgi:DNA-binding GntR family transcriptional regulator
MAMTDPGAHGPLQRTSLTTAAYHELKRRILSAEWRPATRLVPEEVATALGVSRTPVREALALLARDRLVEISPNGFTHVAKPSATYLAEIADLRKVLEGWAAGQAVDRIPLHEIQSLQERRAAAYESLRRTGDGALLAKMDEDMHQAILGACGNGALVELLAPIADLISWVRRLGLPQRAFADATADEHAAILDALLAGDCAAAREAMVEHIEIGKQRLLKIAASIGDVAGGERVS